MSMFFGTHDGIGLSMFIYIHLVDLYGLPSSTYGLVAGLLFYPVSHAKILSSNHYFTFKLGPYQF